MVNLSRFGLLYLRHSVVTVQLLHRHECGRRWQQAGALVKVTAEPDTAIGTDGVAVGVAEAAATAWGAAHHCST